MKNLPRYLLVSSIILVQSIVNAQVPVRNEPRHKVVLENNYICLFDVHIAPGDTTLYHIHAVPSVVVIISESVIGTQVFGKAPSAPGKVTPGATSYIDYGAHPLTHRVWNQSPDTFHVMDIELLRQPANIDSCPLLNQPGLKFDWEKQLLRVYHLNLSDGQKYELLPSGCAHLLVVTGGSVLTAPGKDSGQPLKQLKTGQFTWFPPQSAAFISANRDAGCVLLELK
jgi:hypothetical protein